MLINRWLGVAQPKVAKQALQPLNVSPGSIWVLRVGSQTYSYTYPPSIEITNLTTDEIAKAVTDGLVSAYSGSASLSGGSTGVVASVSSEIYAGKWSVVVTGTSNGAPIDVDLTGSDPASSTISVVRLQAGRAAQNEIQRIKFPGAPTGGTWFVRYKNVITAALAYNISSASLQTALRGLSSIGGTNVNVTGTYTTGYTVEFTSSLAATNADTLSAYSTDFTGVASYKLDVTTVGGIGRQTYTMAKLNGDANEQYRFSYTPSGLPADDGFLFTGAATVAQLISALESIASIGTGNAYVEQIADGSFVITLIGSFVGRAGGTLTLNYVSAGSTLALTTTTLTFTATSTVVLITILNMPDKSSGTFTLSYGGLTTAAIAYSTLTAATVNTALSTATITAWTCGAVAGGLYGSTTISLTSAESRYDAGIILPDVTSLVGCNAIDIRTTQIALNARNEVQQINMEANPTGGTFTVTFGANTTAGVAYNASSATLQTALQGLASIGASNATVSGAVGGPFIVEFVAALASASQSLMTGSGASLTLPVTASVTKLNPVSPTGPNWWTNVSNWSLGLVPTVAHVATFDSGTIDCIYGIASVAAVGGIDTYRSYTGRLGLPEIRDDGSPETLQQYLSLSNGGGTIPIRIGLGDEGGGPSVIRIDTQSQDASVTLLYSSKSGGDQLYAVGLAGTMSSIHAADCSLQIATASNLTATIGSIRISPQSKSDDGAVVEWGENAVVTTAEVVAGTVRMGSVPANLTIRSGSNSVRGSGNMSTLVLRNSRLRYLAGGGVGKYGTVTALTTASSLARLTSASHGLNSGDRIFLRGVVGIAGLPDGYYIISKVDANTFDLVGTAPTIPVGASTPTTVSSYYTSGNAQWGLADSVRIGVGGSIDFSELSVTRTIVAPILLQAEDAEVIDTLLTVTSLRLKSDPGDLETSLGNRALIKRE